jgi:hypothetical protein
VSQEQWLELAKKLRNRVRGYFATEQLPAIDDFIKLAASQFDQVSQQA